MDAVETLLAGLRVDTPVIRAHELEAGTTTVAAGTRWVFAAPARGGVALPDVVLGPGDALFTRERATLAGRVDEGGATLLVADFALPGAAGRLLPRPVDVVAPADSEMCRLVVARLVDGLGDDPGAPDTVSVRLLDWLVIGTVRDVLLAGATTATDADVAPALAAIHGDPAADWTVEGLARATGSSRAAFARRFRDAVGTSPLAYLREHRLDLAEQALVTEPDVTVEAVARRVGYSNPFSFSTAFRRHRGVAPSELRRCAPTGPAPSVGGGGGR